MAIRFQCANCGQPIEVDDDWAGQQVGCPFCQKVVATPTSSTLQLGHVPTAEQASTGPLAPPPPPPGADPVFAAPVPRARRSLGPFGFVAAAGGAALFVLWLILVGGVLGAHLDPDRLADQSPVEQQQALYETFTEHHDEMARFLSIAFVATLSSLLGVGLGVASLVRGEPRKGLPIAAIIVGMLSLPCNGCGLMILGATPLPASGTGAAGTAEPEAPPRVDDEAPSGPVTAGPRIRARLFDAEAHPVDLHLLYRHA